MRQISVFLLAAGLLSACAGIDSVHLAPANSVGQVASAEETVLRVRPHLEDRFFVTADGSRLPLSVWRPAGETRAVILALHGFNDYSNAFAFPAPEWASVGVATYAYDQRGFGAAPGRGLWAGERALAKDVAVAAKLLRERHPGVPLYLLGESMGGALAIVSATGVSGAPRPDVDGLILVAPAVWGRQTMGLMERTGLWLSQFVPAMKVSGKTLPVVRHPSDNIPMLRAYNADPLVIKETRADAVRGLVDLMSDAFDAAPRLDLPLLVLYGEHDDIVPREPVARMVARLPAGLQMTQRVAFYPNGYHMLLRDLQSAMVVGDIVTWIDNRAAVLPSGADLEASRLSPERLPALATTAQSRG